MGIARFRFDNEKRRRPESHLRQAMLTPSYVLEPIRQLLGEIELDPCSEPDNPTRAITFYCPPEDGAILPWNANRIFVNPPYGEARVRWVRRSIQSKHEGKQVILLVPSHTDTRIFQEALLNCTSVLFVRARLRFGVLRENRRQEAASHGSALLGFNVDLTPLIRLGIVLKQ